jgi:hypothetical protein
VGSSVPGEAENPRSAFLRDRLRQRCADRAQQARTKRVERERRRNALSSDGEDFGMGSDDEEDQEEVMLNDEVYFHVPLRPHASFYLKRVPFFTFSCFVE